MEKSHAFKSLTGLSVFNTESWKRAIKKQIVRQGYLSPLIRKYRMYIMERIPPEVNIETTSICNSHCIMCPIDRIDRPKRAMDMELFKKIVDECIEYGVKCLKLHNYGEPLITPHFDKMLHYIRSKSPHISIQFASNGFLLNDKWAKIVINEKVDRITVTIDGSTKETFEKVRVGLNYDTLVKNIQHFMDLRKAMKVKLPELYLNIIRMDETRDEIDGFVKQWKNIVDEVGVTSYSTRAGTLPGNEFEVRPVPCFRLWKQMIITNTGKVATCCADWNCESVLGDIRTQSLSEIWRDSIVKRLRRMHLEGLASEILLCKSCNPASWDSFPGWWFISVPIGTN